MIGQCLLAGVQLTDQDIQLSIRMGSQDGGPQLLDRLFLEPLKQSGLCRVNPFGCDQLRLVTAHDFRLDDRVALLPGRIGNAQVGPQPVHRGLHAGDLLVDLFHPLRKRLDSYFHPVLLQTGSVIFVFFGKGLGNLSSQLRFPVVRPKLDNAGVPVLANINHFFQDFPGLDRFSVTYLRLRIADYTPLLGQLAFLHNLVENLL